jgi:hypothetical protein
MTLTGLSGLNGMGGGGGGGCGQINPAGEKLGNGIKKESLTVKQAVTKAVAVIFYRTRFILSFTS